MIPPRGMVHLVGAGPGDPGLITVSGLAALRQADVVIFDRLVDKALLDEAPRDAERIDVGKRPGDAPVSQEQINKIIIDQAGRGLRVVRLKGGDPFVFGRGFEELSACREAQISCVVIPGVSSAIAAPEMAGIPLTLRGVSRSFAVLTAETAPDTSPTDFSRLQGLDTLVILMGRSKLESIVYALVESGWRADTPVACIERASTPQQRIVTGTLRTIAGLAQQAELAAPMVTVVGEVADYGQILPSPSDIRHSQPKSLLAGKRILLTRPRAAAQKLARKIERLGGNAIICPLLRIRIPHANDALDAAIENLPAYNWLAFTSAHGVTAFWRRLVACGHDARRLSGCKLTAIGLATARRLLAYGLKADVTAHNAGELAASIIADSEGTDLRVLWPRGDQALSVLSSRLRAAGFTVDDPVAYHTVPVQPSEAVLREIAGGVDAVVLYSPSAAKQLAELEVPLTDALTVCIGQTTAQAASTAGVEVEAVASNPSDDGVLDELVRIFAGKVTV